VQREGGFWRKIRQQKRERKKVVQKSPETNDQRKKTRLETLLFVSVKDQGCQIFLEPNIPNWENYTK
jgi:hypothetical protein